MAAIAASRFETTLGIPIREAYGMTETAGQIAYTPWFAERRRGSVDVAVPAMEVRIVAEGPIPTRPRRSPRANAA